MDYNYNMNSYQVEKNLKEKTLLRKLIVKLPSFSESFFISKESQTTTLTLIAYARDLQLFFSYLCEYKEEFFGKTISSLTISDMECVSANDIIYYLSYVSAYKSNKKVLINNESAKKRKLCAIRSFFKHYFNIGLLSKDVSSKVANPKLKSKPITRLEVDEVVKVLDTVDKNANPTTRQEKYNTKVYERDRAIMTLFLGTGIRVSELVGLNIDDFDFHNMAFKVTRKGGTETLLYFNEEIEEALSAYFKIRLNSTKVDSTERALFLSIQNKRIGVRAVEKLVKKYAQEAVPLKRITPHKLRSTYGTNLYRETHDIYVVAEVLGHKDINTTKKHYAAIGEDIKRMAASKVILRDKKNEED